jgi:hypothetical protein
MKVKISNTFKNTENFVLFLRYIGRDMWGRRLAYKAFCWESLKKIDTSEDLGLDEMMIMKTIFKKWDRMWTGLNWFKIGTSGRLW